MRVVVSASGRFHSVHLVGHLKARGLLHYFCSAGLSANDLKLLPKNFVGFCGPVNILDRIYVKFSLDRVLSPSRWYTLRDNWFDFWSFNQIQKLSRFDLFVGWANCSLKCMKLLKKHPVKTVIESGSMHILVQEKILKDEYEKWGVRFPPIVTQNKEKMLEEYALADRICVPSSHVVKSFLDQGFEEKKIIKVHYGIDVCKFGTLKHVQPKKFTLLFVGQISLQKGIGYLLKAWKQLNFGPNQAELVLVGNVSSECRTIIKDFLKSDKSIHLVGPVAHEKLAQIYSSASAFVLPSIQEGLAMVIGEAMAAGLPVICTTVSGGQELIDDGVEGFLVEPGDVDGLAAKIFELFCNPEMVKMMGNFAYQKARTRSWQDYADEAIDEYEKLLREAA